MKSKLIVLGTAAVFACGISSLRAQDAPKPPPPGEGGKPAGGPAGDPRTRFEEMFKKMDANGDGKISKEEWVEFRKKEAEEQFSKMDAEKTGTIDKAKMEGMMMRAMAQRGGQGRGGPDGMSRPEGASGGDGFRRGEGDGGRRQRPGADSSKPSDGNPPPPPASGQGGSDGRRGFGQGGGRGMGGGTALGELFRVIQEKGEVTKEEFAKISDDQFKKLDANGDGKITKEEFEASMQKAREQFGGRARGGDGQGRAPGGDGAANPRPAGDAATAPKRPEAN